MISAYIDKHAATFVAEDSKLFMLIEDKHCKHAAVPFMTAAGVTLNSALCNVKNSNATGMAFEAENGTVSSGQQHWGGWLACGAGKGLATLRYDVAATEEGVGHAYPGCEKISLTAVKTGTQSEQES